MYPNYNVYNISGRGVSLADHLFHLKKGDHFLNTPLNSPVILIYTYPEDHIFRESCSTACLSNANTWRLYSPRYEIKDQALIYTGSHINKYPRSALINYIFNSNLIKDRHIPPLYSEENILRHRLILDAFYDEVSRHKNIINAYHYFGFYNFAENVNSVIPSVLKSHFKPIILNLYDQGLFRAGINPYLIKYDTHPSALGYEASFNTVQSVLRVDFPKQF